MEAHAETEKKSKKDEVVLYEPKLVKVGWRARKDDGDISEIAESIERIGQLHPITVRLDKEGAPVLIAGLRRLRACRKLGIRVRVHVIQPGDELENLAIQLEENIKRKDFDRLEVGEGLKRYKELYEKRHGLGRGWNLKKAARDEKGRAKGTERPAENFVKETARVLAVSERTVYDLLGIASLPDEDKEQITQAKTTSQRNAAARQAVSKVRKQRKLEELEKEGKEKEKARAKAKAKDGKPATEATPDIIAGEGDFKGYLKNPAFMKTYKGKVDLICTDPMYDLERNPILHTDRATIAEASLSKWDKLDIAWVLDVAPLLTDTGTVIAHCPMELVGLYKVAFMKARLIYRGCIIWHKCISENTLIPVLTTDGLHRLRPAEIQPGDRIVSTDGNNASILATVLGTEQMGRRESLLRITLADGNMAEVTGNHRIPVGENKMTDADQLCVGDKVQVATKIVVDGVPMKIRESRITDDGTGSQHLYYPAEFRPIGDGLALVPITKIETVEGCAVWDLQVDSPSHLFAVDHGMLVHNSNPPPAHRAVYSPSVEAIVWATRGEKYTFQPWKNAGTLEAHNFIETPVCGGKERLAHPFQKPLELVQRLVARHTTKGALVFDPFMGTGTTLVACKKLGLRAVGVDVEPKFVKMAKVRLAAT